MTSSLNVSSSSWSLLGQGSTNETFDSWCCLRCSLKGEKKKKSKSVPFLIKL